MGGGLFPPFSLSFFLLLLFFLSVPFVLLHLSFFPFTSFCFVVSFCGCVLLCEIFSSLLKLAFLSLLFSSSSSGCVASTRFPLATALHVQYNNLLLHYT